MNRIKCPFVNFLSAIVIQIPWLPKLSENRSSAVVVSQRTEKGAEK